MIIRFIIFAAIGILVLFGSHFFVCFSLIRLFRIENPTIQKIVIIAFVFLSISFILASILAHFQDNLLSRVVYFLSSFWLGLLTNLFLASLLLWILYPLLSRIENISVSSWIIFGGAFIFSLYAIYSALIPQVKNLEITIKSLPEYWKGKTIVQISDVHLGHIYRFDFLKRLISQINELHPDLILVTGDLFDGMDGNLSYFASQLDQLESKQGVFFVTGNHETYLGTDKVFNLLRNTHIQALDDQVVNIEGLQIVGYSYPPREEMGASTKDFSQTIANIHDFVYGKPTILLHHAPIDIEAAKKAGVNLQLSGHTHKGQLFPFNFITHLIYKGYDYGLKTDGDYSIYTSNGVGTWGPPMRTGNTSEIVVIKLK